MAQLTTLGDLREAAEDLIVTDDFTDFANKAVKRLYAKAATTGRVVELRFKTVAFANPADIGNIEFKGEEDDVYHLPKDFDNVLKFLVNGKPRDVIPVESTYSASGWDETAFVDLGEDDDGNRSYRRPYDIVNLGTATGDVDEGVTGLARLAYEPVVNDLDTFSFSNVDALKLAVMATTYEDQNDLERANQFWEQAKMELEIESARFRGPQKMHIGIFDAAAQDVTQSIN